MPHPIALIASLALGLASGCAKSDPPKGSETHFLEACSADCEGDLKCVSGRCTRDCEADAECDALHAQATCQNSGSANGTCQVDCGRQLSCAELNEQWSCYAGYCGESELAPAGPTQSSTVDASAGQAEPSDDCLDIGCFDETTIDVIPPASGFADGTHSMDLPGPNGTELRCSLTVSDSVVVDTSCEGDVDAEYFSSCGNESNCEDSRWSLRVPGASALIDIRYEGPTGSVNTTLLPDIEQVTVGNCTRCNYGSVQFTLPPPDTDAGTGSVAIEEICADPESFAGRPLELDLSGLVTEERLSGGVVCSLDAGAACPLGCNWVWVDYVVECPNGGSLKLSAEGEPYGAATASWTGDDSLGPKEVRMGCEGDECAPTCVPETPEAIHRVRATVATSPDAGVDHLAELRIEAALP